MSRAPKAAPGQGLLVASQAAASLTPEQRRYNQLVAQVERVRAELQAWQDEVPPLVHTHMERLQTLRQALGEAGLQMALALQALLSQTGWTKPQRAVLERELVDTAAHLAEDDTLSETDRQAMHVLHDRFAEVSLEDERRSELEAFRDMVQAASGLDLGDEDFDSEEELLARARRALDEQSQRQAQAEAEAAPATRRPRRPSATQRRLEQQAQDAAQSVREVYRKLASALHPDRASDAADRERRTTLMARANQAYERQDLLQLFALQLEIEQVDPAHLAQASGERLGHYSRVLKAQLEELRAELAQREQHFAAAFGVPPWERVAPRRVNALLKAQAREMREALVERQRQLWALRDPRQVRTIVKHLKARQHLQDITLRDLF